jgi:hypothetical protein
VPEPPQTPLVRNRRELRDILENRLLAPEPEEESFEELEEGEGKSIKPKTYLIESNKAPLENIARKGNELKGTEDKTLWNIVSKDPQNRFSVYLDILDPRFWKVHSVYYARESNSFVRSLIRGDGSRLDNFWLSSDSLDVLVGDRGTAFGLKYRNVFEADEESPKVSMNYWGRGTNEVLRALKGIPEIQNKVSLSKVGVDFLTDAGHVKTDIFKDGRLRARSGDSIESYLSLVELVTDYYSQILANIEQNHVMKYEYSENYCTVHGSYSAILFSSPLSSLTAFAETLTSGNEPFRIWGLWRSVDNSFVRIKGVDLHTNTPLELELMPDELRIVLGEGACGNVVTRLFTNIQAHFDSSCSLKGLNDANLIRTH